jgi:hypothetical protein
MDVKIPCNLEVYCTRKSPTEDYEPRSVLLNGFEIIDLIDKISGKKSEIVDQWDLEGMDGVEDICVDLEFEVTFSSLRELDDVCLCQESIIDIISDDEEDKIYTQAKADFIAQKIDEAYHNGY